MLPELIHFDSVEARKHKCLGLGNSFLHFFLGRRLVSKLRLKFGINLNPDDLRSSASFPQFLRLAKRDPAGKSRFPTVAPLQELRLLGAVFPELTPRVVAFRPCGVALGPSAPNKKRPGTWPGLWCVFSFWLSHQITRSRRGRTAGPRRPGWSTDWALPRPAKGRSLSVLSAACR